MSVILKCRGSTRINLDDGFQCLPSTGIFATLQFSINSYGYRICQVNFTTFIWSSIFSTEVKKITTGLACAAAAVRHFNKTTEHAQSPLQFWFDLGSINLVKNIKRLHNSFNVLKKWLLQLYFFFSFCEFDKYEKVTFWCSSNVHPYQLTLLFSSEDTKRKFKFFKNCINAFIWGNAEKIGRGCLGQYLM